MWLVPIMTGKSKEFSITVILPNEKFEIRHCIFDQSQVNKQPKSCNCFTRVTSFLHIRQSSAKDQFQGMSNKCRFSANSRAHLEMPTTDPGILQRLQLVELGLEQARLSILVLSDRMDQIESELDSLKDEFDSLNTKVDSIQENLTEIKRILTAFAGHFLAQSSASNSTQ